MQDFTGEVFGSETQQALERRGAAQWTLLKDNPDFSCHGRAVAVTGRRPDTVSAQIALARLQGVAPSDHVPNEHAEARRATLRAAGLEIDEYVNWQGGPEAVAAARQVLAARPLAADLELLAVDADTPSEEVARLDTVTRACGVLLPMGRFLRNLERPARFLYARTLGGHVVGTAAAVAQYHPDSPDAEEFWWGMLATDECRRGEGIALILGAAAIVRMADDLGMTDFSTGVRAGNAPSERLCTRLGLSASARIDMIAIDPAAFAGGRMTK